MSQMPLGPEANPQSSNPKQTQVQKNPKTLSPDDKQALNQFANALEKSSLKGSEKQLIQGKLNTLKDMFLSGGSEGKKLLQSLEKTLLPLTQSLKSGANPKKVLNQLSSQLDSVIGNLSQRLKKTPEGQKLLKTIENAQKNVKTAPIQQDPSQSPIKDPPKDNPPVNKQPITPPPKDSPPVNKQPIAPPPKDSPPVNKQPITPPKDSPPVNKQPITPPPKDNPPVNKQPITPPPKDSPPVNKQPIPPPPKDSPQNFLPKNKTQTPQLVKESQGHERTSPLTKQEKEQPSPPFMPSNQTTKDKGKETLKAPVLDPSIPQDNLPKDTIEVPKEKLHTLSPSNASTNTSQVSQSQRVEQVKQIVTQMVSHIQTIASKEQQQVTLTLNAPPQLQGVKIEIQSPQNAPKQLDIQFQNLSPDQQRLLQESIQNNPQSQKQLSDALQSHGFTVNKLEISQPTQANDSQGQGQNQEEKEQGQQKQQNPDNQEEEEAEKQKEN